MFCRTYHINIYFGKTGGGKTVSAVYMMYKLHRKNQRRERKNEKIRKQNSRWAASGSKWGKFRLRVRMKRELPLLNIYTNIETTFETIPVTRDDLVDGVLTNGTLFLDEGSLMFNNREFKTFPKTAQRFFRYHRKHKLNICVFTQSFDDTDKVIRELAHNEFMAQKFLRFWIAVMPVKRWMGIDDITQKYQDKRKFRWIFASKFYFWPRWSLYFDTTQRLE
jgi:hypothetical protein